MKTGDQGERDFLKSISYMVRSVSGAKLGFDDDASDLPLSTGEHLVINVDTFVRETDWLPDMTPAQAGRKASGLSQQNKLNRAAGLPKNEEDIYCTYMSIANCNMYSEAG